MTINATLNHSTQGNSPSGVTPSRRTRIVRRAAMVVAGVVAIEAAAIAAALIFGGPTAPPTLASVSEPFHHVDFSGLPALRHFTARDGAALAYRLYPGDPKRVVVLIHGSSGMSASVHPLASAFQAENATVYAIDLRGHGGSGPHGDIAYNGQLDDDMADLVRMIRTEHPDAALTLAGFSSGGGFTLRIAGGPLGEAFDRYILISPFLQYDAPTMRANSGGWVGVAMPRIIALTMLDAIGVTAFDGLPVLAFAIPPENAAIQTPTYSMRLERNLSPRRDYLGDLKRAPRPIALFVGSDDDEFYADRFAPLLKPVRPDLAVTVLPGFGHIDMVTAPGAVHAIAADWAAH
jgi:alpha-beta hydrolase superfamily lysophospholipase